MFSELKKVLQKGGAVVMAIPFYFDRKEVYLYPFVDKIEDLGYFKVDLTPSCCSQISEFYSERGTILYKREDQIVGREIIKFIIKDNGT
jgi:hypothetical protein